MVTAMWSVSNRTGTSNSKSAVTSTSSAGAVPKVMRPVVVSTDQPDPRRDCSIFYIIDLILRIFVCWISLVALEITLMRLFLAGVAK
jgi:hypothetical protein